jgi:hypothetical protein
VEESFKIQSEEKATGSQQKLDGTKDDGTKDDGTKGEKTGRGLGREEQGS